MKKKGMSRWLAGMLAGAVALTGIPADTVRAAETSGDADTQTTELLADFDF